MAIITSDMETRTVKRGTIVKIGGIPFVLVDDADLETHKNNWRIAFEDGVQQEPMKKASA